MITFKQLSYALAVQKALHFKKAAEQCAVSQSALSTAISELESQLGVQIFERDNKRVLVTTLGQAILRRAQTITLEVQELQQLAQQHNTPLSHPMTLGVIPTIGPYLLPRVLPEVRRQYPDFSLTLIEEQSHILLEQVRSGEIDAAILALPYDTRGLHAFTFWQENFQVVVSQTGDYARLKKIRSEQLTGAPLLLLKDGHCLKEHALAACKLQPTTIQSTLAGTSLPTLVQMVAGRMGATLVPDIAIEQLVADNPEIKALPLDEPGPHRKYAFITRLNYSGTASIELLMTLFAGQLADL